MQILAPTEQDIRQMIAARVHLGDTNADHRMMHYVHSVSISVLAFFVLELMIGDVNSYF